MPAAFFYYIKYKFLRPRSAGDFYFKRKRSFKKT